MLYVLQVQQENHNSFKVMTLNEKVLADSANSQLAEVGAFANTFRSGAHVSVKEGEILTIPTGAEFKVYENRTLGKEGMHPQYINCPTSEGRIVELYPSMFTRIAIEVDDNCKTVQENGRAKVHNTGGDVAKFVAGKAIDATMRAMQGCQVKFSGLKTIKTRKFGVPVAEATKDDVTTTVIGNWDFVGEKRPEGYVG